MGGEKQRDINPVASCFCPHSPALPQQRFPASAPEELRGAVRTGQNRPEPAVTHLRQPRAPLTQTPSPAAAPGTCSCPKSCLGLSEGGSEAALDSRNIEAPGSGWGVAFSRRDTAPGAASPLTPAGQEAERTPVRMAQLPFGSRGAPGGAPGELPRWSHSGDELPPTPSIPGQDGGPQHGGLGLWTVWEAAASIATSSCLSHLEKESAGPGEERDEGKPEEQCTRSTHKGKSSLKIV